MLSQETGSTYTLLMNAIVSVLEHWAVNQTELE